MKDPTPFPASPSPAWPAGDETPIRAAISAYGILDNLRAVPAPRRPPGPGEVEVRVRATGLNFRDVVGALGMLQEYSRRLGIRSAEEMPFGFECAGEIAAVGAEVAGFEVGDEVIAALATGCLGTFVTLRAEFVVLRPSGISPEQAATVPIAFLTAYHTLYRLAKTRSGDRVLIHCAAGGVGQAAVQLARLAGAEILATASPGKWELVQSLGVRHVMNSRTLDFAAQVMQLTEGRGVDVVLNSLRGEFASRSLEICSRGGRFIEIGKIEILSQADVRARRPDVDYTVFDLEQAAADTPGLVASTLHELMRMLEDGRLKPLPFQSYAMRDMVKAFRLMAQGRHTGKLVIVPGAVAGSDRPPRRDAADSSAPGLGSAARETGTAGGKPAAVGEPDYRDLIKKSLLELRSLRSKLEKLERARREPIAIIGVGCRFPGAESPAAFWRMLRDGVDATREVPGDRWNLDAYYDPDPGAPGRMYTRRGGFLEQIDGFDPEFFGISPREAASLSPQQRLLLEVTWETLEDANQVPERLFGTSTGIFVGICGFDFGPWGSGGAESWDRIDAYMPTGTMLSMAAARLSYVLGLTGPSLVLDTACSSSLVSVHLACQSLRQGECDLALAGGAGIMTSPGVTIGLCRIKALAPDGRCKTFDASADGYARGEGCGMVALQRLSDAQAAGAPILAVIRGSAVNQDGASGGLTVPSGPSQRAVIRQALENAGVQPADVSYVEAHGTGTPLGDPIEIGALDVVYGGRSKTSPLIVGSVKPNVGHLEAAAGIAGLIKVVLALRHGEIPAHLHLRSPNPHIPWEQLPVSVPTERMRWPRTSSKRIAGVSSFGLGGTNAHVVIEEGPAEGAARAVPDRPWHVLALSAKTPEALREMARRYESHLAGDTGLDLGDVCHTASTGRSHHEHRLGLTAASLGELRERLAAWADGRDPPGSAHGRAREDAAPRVGMLFSGQGSQYIGMGRQLYDTQPTFRKALDRCDELLRPRLGEGLLSVLYPRPDAASPLDQTCYTQPALFALEYALAALWRSWGVEPSVVMGHSIGEYVAACVAGVFSLEDGLRLIAERGRLMQQLPRDGEMAAVFASEERVVAASALHAAEVSIAAINGPEQVVISGRREGVKAIRAALAEAGINSRDLNVSHAFHSPLMEPIRGAFARVAREVTYSPPRVPIVSNATGEPVADPIAAAGYWVEHLRQPVRFAQSIRTLLGLLRGEGDQRAPAVVLEVGPKATLLAMGPPCVSGDQEAAETRWLCSLRPGKDDWQQMLESLAALYVDGARIDWPGFDRDYARHRVALPTYPFQRSRFPVETDAPARRAAGPARGGSPPLGHAARTEDDPLSESLYEVAWRVEPRLRPASEALPPPAEIVARAASELAEVAVRTDLRTYSGVLRELEDVSLDFVLTALAALGWEPRPGRRFSTAGLIEQLCVAPRHRRLFARCLDMLAEEGLLLRLDGAQWEVTAMPSPGDPARRIGALRESHPMASAELTLLERCGSRLSEVLRGACDPLGLLFPAGDVTTANQLYQDSPGFKAMNGLVERAVIAAVAGLPGDRMLRALEIGAGTGSTTARLLPHLRPDRTEYVFTDISPLFTAAAQEKFRDFPFLSYRTLDIGKPPEIQGFDAGGFDIVVAANVLHATRNLRETLAHTRRLLRAGGLLVLLEATVPQRWVDLIFGLTEGWWSFSDEDLRTDYALLSAPRWRELLERSGFEAACSMPSEPPADGLLSQHAVIVARNTSGVLEPRRWLVLADSAGIGRQLAAALRSRGEACNVVFRGSQFDSPEPGVYTVDPARPADFERLIGEPVVREDLQGIVHLWSVDSADAKGISDEDLEAASRLGCRSALYLLQSLLRGGLVDRPEVWWVTRGAQDAGRGSTASSVGQAPLWGFGRVVASEHPELRGGLIDLDPSASPEQAAASLLDEIGRPGKGAQVALRGEERCVARLVRARTAAGPEPGLRADATYLVTGGLGGLGLVVARWLVERGARHLMLVGRAGPSPRAREILTELENAGARVETRQADVSSRPHVAEVLQHISGSMPPLRGVVHAAGAVDDALLVNQSWERFERVFAAKVRGAWILHTLTLGAELDFFVLFSTAAAIVGSVGQANHAAANLFLDALAHHRRATGLPGLAIDWGAWSEVGAAASDEVLRGLAERGIGSLNNRQGLEALSRAWPGAAAQIAVMPMDWPKFFAHFPRGSAPAFFDEVAVGPAAGREGRPMPERAPAVEPGNGVSGAATFTRQLEQAPAGERWGLLRARVEREVAAVLGLDPSRSIDGERGFFQMGLDSLMSVELKSRVASMLGVMLPVSLVFNYPTVDALTRYLGAEVIGLGAPGQEDGAAAQHGAGVQPAGAELAHLSKSDVDAMLDDELASIEVLLPNEPAARHPPKPMSTLEEDAGD